MGKQTFWQRCEHEYMTLERHLLIARIAEKQANRVYWACLNVGWHFSASNPDMYRRRARAYDEARRALERAELRALHVERRLAAVKPLALPSWADLCAYQGEGEV